MDEKQTQMILTWLIRLDGKADAIRAELSIHNATLVQQASSLTEHIRRTEIAEAGLATLRAEVKPIAVHVAVVGAFGKVLLGCGGVATLATLVLKLLGKL